MSTGAYNGAAADVETITAGTRLYRILSTDSNATFPLNSFNESNIRPLGHDRQGRFDPLDPTYGGYLYVATSPAGVVAEGILRDVNIPASGLIRRHLLAGKKLGIMTLQTDLTVASLHGSRLQKLNLDGHLTCCKRWGSDGEEKVDNYTWTRSVGYEILTNTAEASGFRYTGRNNPAATSLMLLNRYGTPNITINDELDILRDEEGRKLVFETLDSDFGLKVPAGFSGQR